MKDHRDDLQLVLPLRPSRPERADASEVLLLRGRPLGVRFVRNRRARHYILRVEADETLRVTIPRGGSRAEARAFVRKQLPWIEAQRYAQARHAASIFFRGQPLPIEIVTDGARRTVRLGAERVPLRPGEDAKRGVCRYLRAIAAGELPVRLRELARQFTIPVTRVTIRNQRTRWGSCSAGGDISLNWRLVQMPESVRDYILVHELMHVREASHSRRFWRLVEEHCPGHRAARKWLKAHEAELR